MASKFQTFCPFHYLTFLSRFLTPCENRTIFQPVNFQLFENGPVQYLDSHNNVFGPSEYRHVRHSGTHCFINMLINQTCQWSGRSWYMTFHRYETNELLQGGIQQKTHKNSSSNTPQRNSGFRWQINCDL